MPPSLPPGKRNQKDRPHPNAVLQRASKRTSHAIASLLVMLGDPSVWPSSRMTRSQCTWNAGVMRRWGGWVHMDGHNLRGGWTHWFLCQPIGKPKLTKQHAVNSQPRTPNTTLFPLHPSPNPTPPTRSKTFRRPPSPLRAAVHSALSRLNVVITTW